MICMLKMATIREQYQIIHFSEQLNWIRKMCIDVMSVIKMDSTWTSMQMDNHTMSMDHAAFVSLFFKT